MKKEYIVISNNPYVYEQLKDTVDMIFQETSYEGILKVVRNEIHKGAVLLSHPLSGSIKPKETPYKSVMVKKGKKLDQESLQLIESALQTCDKFEDKSNQYNEKVFEDFQLIDWRLISGAMESANAYV